MHAARRILLLYQQLAACGVDPSRCIVIEDAVNGILAGCAAGARCVGLTTSFSEDTLRQAGARWIAADLGACPLPARLA